MKAKKVTLQELLSEQTISPFIRECDLPVRSPWVYQERRLLDYLLVYVEKGRCRFIIDGKEYLFLPGDFCLVQPNCLLHLEGLTETVTPFAHFDIFYHPGREKSFPTRPGQTDLTAYMDLMQPRLNDVHDLHVPFKLQPSNPLRMRENLVNAIRLWQRHDPLSTLKAHQLMTDIIIAILEDHAIRTPSRETQKFPKWIPSYISMNLSEPLSVESMAARAHLSPSHFSALFKKHYGMSPHQYVIEMRIQHAKELLETTDLPQEAIAAYCGFADIHHFSKTFKKRTGFTPGEWAKRQRSLSR